MKEFLAETCQKIELSFKKKLIEGNWKLLTGVEGRVVSGHPVEQS